MINLHLLRLTSATLLVLRTGSGLLSCASSMCTKLYRECAERRGATDTRGGDKLRCDSSLDFLTLNSTTSGGGGRISPSSKNNNNYLLLHFFI
jgi:hypothetical protein